jgi:hypothetical protein
MLSIFDGLNVQLRVEIPRRARYNGFIKSCRRGGRGESGGVRA